MKLEIEIHPAQGEILKVLTFNPKAKFVELNKTGLTTDHFNFHVRRLIELGLIQKDKDGLYLLTNTGKGFASRMDVESADSHVEKQGRLSVIVGCFREKNGCNEVLIQKRLKNPYFGYHGFIGGKIRFGETILEAASRELAEETGLSAEKLEIVGMKHKMDYDVNKELLDDKYFFVVRGAGLSGNLKEVFESGQNMWMKEDDFFSISERFEGIEDQFGLFKGSKHVFIEKKHGAHGY